MTNVEKEQLKVMIGSYINACIGIVQIKHQNGGITEETMNYTTNLLSQIKNEIKTKIIADFEKHI